MDDATEDWAAEPGGLLEHAFGCPHCGETITMLLDLSEPDQEYIEDCEVCCNPIAVQVRARGGHLEGFDASSG